MNVLGIIGTEKGAFLIRSDESRQAWTIDGPVLKGWKVTAAARDDEGTFFLGTASQIYGATIQTSKDLTEWTQVECGPAYPEEADRKLKQIWKILPGNNTYWAGVDDAGLFRSDDKGAHWAPVTGLNDHATRASWFPGAGGLCAHSILIDPTNPNRMWCGISAVGVFRSEDGGSTWTPKNEGVPVIIEDKEHKDIGRCVHTIVLDPTDPNTVYRQDHLGMFVSTDAGDSWKRTENGLPKRAFGFPLVIDPETKALFAFPLEADEFRLPVEGKFTVYRSRTGGDSWEPLTKGLPQENAYMGVLRTAMAVDTLSPCGVYVGSTSGTVHVSSNLGDSWQTLDCVLPRILTFETFLED